MVYLGVLYSFSLFTSPNYSQYMYEQTLGDIFKNTERQTQIEKKWRGRGEGTREEKRKGVERKPPWVHS